MWSSLAFGLAALATRVFAENLLTFDDDFSMTWEVSGDKIQISLTWRATDWAAVGLHPHPNLGMPNAEIFMVTGEGAQVRNSNAGYVMPELDKNQYISLVSMSNNGHYQTTTFERSLAAADGSPRSVAITDTTLGLIYARGAWNGTFPAGNPLKHQGTEGRAELNFFNPAKPTPAPTANPHPSHKKAGVWPLRWQANVTIAPSQHPSPKLKTSLHSKLYYDFVERNQLWLYYSADQKFVGGELWHNTTLHTISPDGTCSSQDMGFSFVRPNWLQGTDYISTHYLLRPDVEHKGFIDYTKADLFQIPNTLGMTNSWLVADSRIAEPVRLEGPDDFNHPSYISFLEFADFNQVSTFPADLFNVNKYCKKQHTGTQLRRRSPGALLHSMAAALHN